MKSVDPHSPRGDAPIRVASIPSAHPYVEHLGVAAQRLPDPTPPGAPPGRWWPPVMLDPAWIEANADAFDLMHLHFGAESSSTAHLREVLAALRRAGRPLVHTVHDLEHPQLVDQTLHRAHLDVLVPGADALITLTSGAADEIKRRWGRRPEVIAHPHMVGLDVEPPVGERSDALVVGLHLRDLRPNVDGVGTTRALLGAVARLRARGRLAEARVDLFESVRDESARDGIRALCAAAGSYVTLREGPRLSEGELLESVAALDVSVLPYAWGTHSGWVELCWDLGVAVAAPAGVGYAAQQHVEPGFCEPYAAQAEVELVAAIDRGARADSSFARPGTPDRRELVRRRRLARETSLREIASAHAALYATVVSFTA